jgi:multiple sugar transport system permease protein
MTSLLWFVGILFALVATTYLVSAMVAAFRLTRMAMVGNAALLLVILFGVAFGVKHPVALIITALITAFAGMKLLSGQTRNANHATQTFKLSAAHMTLLAGSFMFMIPFAWLISTSLKGDDEQASFPPVWIPTQQKTVANLNNKEGLPAKLSQFKGKQLVAEVEDLPSGSVKVQPMLSETQAGTDATFEATHADLTKVRHTAPRWENYSEALAYLPPDTLYGLTFLKNTLILTLLTTIGTLLASSLVAYSFSRLQWPGKNLLFTLLLATMMVPGAVTLMPQFLIFRNLGWIDTLRPLWVPAFFGGAFNIFMLRQFFLSIPTELEDAAKIDGCGPFGIYWRVMLPLVQPALAAIAIMAILGAWNNFQGPLIYLSSPENMPLAYGLQLYQQQHAGEPGLLMAASTMVIMPIMILFFFTQRYFIEGVSLTGLGGR